ncbi:divergent polysaccharide deacetylase family protein [Fodinicurvata sediminis]|uniref:divergent polysaccharide deacetylase family protein n=1 Tax=Fodinicurvata sediminis TaxID=1121832 RepID=UPI0004237041|nr:divergent polysaccharide deacetylase family protein [Fodinicurvata sediminis]
MTGKRITIFGLGILLTLGVAVAFGLPGNEVPDRESQNLVEGRTEQLNPVASPGEVAGIWPIPEAKQPDRPEVLPPPDLGGTKPAAVSASPWKTYSVAAEKPDGTPRIAIIIDDVGVNRPAARKAAKLAPPFTLSYLSYADNVEELIAEAQVNGHEIMLHLPMEPMNGDIDPGPRALKSDQALEERQQDLEWALERFGQYVGVNNHMGSRLTADRQAMEQVLGEIKRRGLLFVDSKTSSDTVALEVARELSIPSVGRDVFLDHEQTRSFVEAQLALLENIALEHGSAVGIGHPHEVTLEVLAEWHEDLKQRGFTLVPVSSIVTDTYERIAGLSIATPPEVPEESSTKRQ